MSEPLATQRATGRLPIVALDIGGMSIRSGVVELDRSVHNVRHIPIDHRSSADQLIEAIWQAVAANALQPDVRVAIAVPGPFDHDTGTSEMVHKFAALEGVDIRTALLDRAGQTHLDIRFVNDAAAAGAGEVLAAGCPTGHTLTLTLGTGLGSSLFDGRTLVETYENVDVSMLWARPIADDIVADERFSASGLAAALGVDPDHLPVTSKTPDAAAVLTMWGGELGAFVESLRGPLALHRTIIGGGAAGAFEQFGMAAAAAATIPITQAKLGSSGPLLGAAALAFDID